MMLQKKLAVLSSIREVIFPTEPSLPAISRFRDQHLKGTWTCRGKGPVS